jgi:hypothetical protein
MEVWIPVPPSAFISAAEAKIVAGLRLSGNRIDPAAFPRPVHRFKWTAPKGESVWLTIHLEGLRGQRTRDECWTRDSEHGDCGNLRYTLYHEQPSFAAKPFRQPMVAKSGQPSLAYKI